GRQSNRASAPAPHPTVSGSCRALAHVGFARLYRQRPVRLIDTPFSPPKRDLEGKNVVIPICRILSCEAESGRDYRSTSSWGETAISFTFPSTRARIITLFSCWRTTTAGMGVERFSSRRYHNTRSWL